MEHWAKMGYVIYKFSMKWVNYLKTKPLLLLSPVPFTSLCNVLASITKSLQTNGLKYFVSKISYFEFIFQRQLKSALAEYAPIYPPDTEENENASVAKTFSLKPDDLDDYLMFKSVTDNKLIDWDPVSIILGKDYLQTFEMQLCNDFQLPS